MDFDLVKLAPSNSRNAGETGSLPDPCWDEPLGMMMSGRRSTTCSGVTIRSFADRPVDSSVKISVGFVKTATISFGQAMSQEEMRRATTEAEGVRSVPRHRVFAQSLSGRGAPSSGQASWRGLGHDRDLDGRPQLQRAGHIQPDLVLGIPPMHDGKVQDRGFAGGTEVVLVSDVVDVARPAGRDRL